MGTLVFQATLGGSVNLIGPNTASTINFTLPSADGTSGQALATNGSGTLAFSSFATLISNTFTGSQTLSAGTANGVTYLNGSKVLTSGSALTFDGTKWTQTASTTGILSEFKNSNTGNQNGNIVASNDAGTAVRLQVFGSAAGSYGMLSASSPVLYTSASELNFVADNASGVIKFGLNGSAEQMRLTSTGLGIGTSSPAAKLHVVNTVYVKGSASSDGDKGITIGSGSGAVNSSSHAIRTGGGLGDLLIIETETANSSGQILFNTNNAERARISSAGNFFIGSTTFPVVGTEKFGVAGGSQIAGAFGNTVNTEPTLFVSNASNTTATYLARFTSGSGGTTRGEIYYNGAVLVYATSSDYRLKTVIGAVTGHGERLDALEPVEYTWNSNGQRTRGFLAHKFQEVYEHSVSGEKDAVDANGNPVYQSMQASTPEVIADLVAEIKSLRKRLADAGIA